jgi:hypothetical protein
MHVAHNDISCHAPRRSLMGPVSRATGTLRTLRSGDPCGSIGNKRIPSLLHAVLLASAEAHYAAPSSCSSSRTGSRSGSARSTQPTSMSWRKRPGPGVAPWETSLAPSARPLAVSGIRSAAASGTVASPGVLAAVWVFAGHPHGLLRGVWLTRVEMTRGPVTREAADGFSGGGRDPGCFVARAAGPQRRPDAWTGRFVQDRRPGASAFGCCDGS